MADPRREYAARLEARLAIVARQERFHIRLGNTKLATLVAGLVVAWLSLAKHLFPSAWVPAFAAIYVALAILHGSVLRTRARAERAVAFYRQGMARIEDRWPGTGSTGDRFRDPKHVYADDLDLFGPGSLFEVLSSARTPMGESRLAEWLLAASPVPVVLERQAIVSELRDRLDLREDLALAGEELVGKLNPSALANWAETARQLPSSLWRILITVLPLTAIATLVWALRTSDYGPLLVVLLLETIVWRTFRARAQAVLDALDADALGLDLFSAILARLESESFSAPRLQKFITGLKEGRTPASVAVKRLARIAYWREARDSFIVRLLSVPLLTNVQIAFAAESWRSRYGPRLRAWMDAVAETEALLSLAGYSYEHPADPFPEFAESASGALFAGEQLGHPLIPQDRCITNSVHLGGADRILMVSGSNMSGKSTFLRTVGVNAVLAMAGAPIRGVSLRLSPFLVGARLRTTDSLQENRSGFYTEVLRIRQIFDLASRQVSVLFLFDEMLEGTNSKDRRIGAQGLLRAFLSRGAVGIVTTHDLALTEITGDLGAAVSNAHFQDYVEDGQMRFDYKLRPGVVARSNALELMRLAGLEI